MSRQALISDEEILEAIDQLRTDYYACTYSALAEHLSMGRPAVQKRVEELQRKGLVVTSGMHGGIARA